jgi:hypothetical protein
MKISYILHKDNSSGPDVHLWLSNQVSFLMRLTLLSKPRGIKLKNPFKHTWRCEKRETRLRCASNKRSSLHCCFLNMKSRDWWEQRTVKKTKKKRNTIKANGKPDQPSVRKRAALNLGWFLSSYHDHNLLHEYGESNCKKRENVSWVRILITLNWWFKIKWRSEWYFVERWKKKSLRADHNHNLL